MSLKDDIARTINGQGPADGILSFSGEQALGKVRNLRGTPERPIVIVGEDDSAVLVPVTGSNAYRASCLRLEDSIWVTVMKCRVDGRENRNDDDGPAWAERAIQVFRSDFVTLEELESRWVRYDHFHYAGGNDGAVRRCRFFGQGGVDMGGGKAGHAIYVTRIDGGPAVARHLWEDCEGHDIAGAAWQANGDGKQVHELTVRRLAAYQYGRFGGGLFNLESVRAKSGDPQSFGARLEDVFGATTFDAGGVRAYSGAGGASGQITLARYNITNPDGQVTDGPVQIIEEGSPAPPDFNEPEPPDPPDPEPEPGDCEEKLAAANARIAGLESELAETQTLLADRERRLDEIAAQADYQ